MVSKWARMFQRQMQESERWDTQLSPQARLNQSNLHLRQQGRSDHIGCHYLRACRDSICLYGSIAIKCKQDRCSIVKFQPKNSCRALLTFWMLEACQVATQKCKQLWPSWRTPCQDASRWWGPAGFTRNSFSVCLRYQQAKSTEPLLACMLSQMSCHSCAASYSKCEAPPAGGGSPAHLQRDGD